LDITLFSRFLILISFQIPKVKSEVAPDLKMTLMVYTNYVPSHAFITKCTNLAFLKAEELYYTVNLFYGIVFKHSRDITILIDLLWFSIVHYSNLFQYFYDCPYSS